MILSGLAVGAVLGIVMQRGRFCVTSMIRDIWLNNKWRNIVALLIVISVHALGIAALTSAGVISPNYSTFAPLAVIVGGLVFGMGIILAGGCASGTWYRSGEGLVGSWIALAMYAVSAAAMKYGVLADFNASMKSWDTGWTTLPAALGVSPWFFAVGLAVVTALLARHFLAKDAARPKAELKQPWYRKPLHMYAAGALVGLIGVIAWPLSAATGRNYGLGITTPTADVLTYSVTAEPERLNWGTLLVLGLLVGSFVAAKVSGEFRLRVPDAPTAVRSVAGGLMMGVGASLAGGCTVGNGMVETSMFSFQGWIALLCIALGIGLGARWWIKPAGNKPAAPAPTYSTEDSVENSAPVSAEDSVLGAPQTNFGVATGLVTLTKPSATDKLTELAPGRFHLDAMGMVCPFPTVEAKTAIATLESGDDMVIDFDCTQGTEALPQWAADSGHSVKDFAQTTDASWTITVTKDGLNS